MLAVFGLAIIICIAAFTEWNWMGIALWMVFGYWALKLWLFRYRYMMRFGMWCAKNDHHFRKLDNLFPGKGRRG